MTIADIVRYRWTGWKLNDDRKFSEYNRLKKFCLIHHFPQHLMHSHSAVVGRWTKTLEEESKQKEKGLDDCEPSTARQPSYIRKVHMKARLQDPLQTMKHGFNGVQLENQALSILVNTHILMA